MIPFMFCSNTFNSYVGILEFLKSWAKDDSDEMVKARTIGLIARCELVLMEDSVEQGGCKMVDCNINAININVHWCYEWVEL